MFHCNKKIVQHCMVIIIKEGDYYSKKFAKKERGLKEKKRL